MPIIRYLLLFAICSIFPITSYARDVNSIDNTTVSSSDILLIQKILNSQRETRIAEYGVGSPGYESGYLGAKTRNAIARFQELYRKEILAPIHLTHPTGQLGPRTLAQLTAYKNSHLELPVEVIIPEISDHEHDGSGPDLPHSAWYAPTSAVVVPEDMWVTAFIPYVANAEKEVLHHMTLYKYGEANPICPQQQSVARELFSASINTINEAAYFPTGYALPLKKGDRLEFEVMTHNSIPPTGPGGDFSQVTIGTRVVGIPMDEHVQMRPLELVRLKLDDTPCANPPQIVAFTIASNTPRFVKTDIFFDTATSSSATYRFTSNGTIIGLGANFWPMKGGKEVGLIYNKTKIAEITPQQYDANLPWAWRIPLLLDYKKEVVNGDTVSLGAIYENLTPHPIKDAVGFLGFYFAPESTTTKAH